MQGERERSDNKEQGSPRVGSDNVDKFVRGITEVKRGESAAQDETSLHLLTVRCTGHQNLGRHGSIFGDCLMATRCVHTSLPQAGYYIESVSLSRVT